MRNLKRKGLALAMMACILTMAACGKKPENHAGVFTDYQYVNGQLSATVSDKLVFQAEVTEPPAENASVLHAVWKNYEGDWHRLAYPFFQQEELQFIEPEDNWGGGVAKTVDNQESLLIFLPGVSFRYSAIDQTNKWYNSALQHWIFQDVKTQKILDKNPVVLPGVSEEKELESFSKQEAIEFVRKTINNLDLPLAEQPRVIYALDFESLEKMRLQMNRDMGVENDPDSPFYMQPFSPEDEAYYLLWEYEYDRVPLLSGNILSGANNILRDRYNEQGATLCAIVKQNEVVFMESQRYLYDIVEKDDPQQVISLEEAAARLPEYYEQVLLEETRTVSSIYFCYVPVLVEMQESQPETAVFDLVPCWVAEASYQRNGKYYWEFSYMNALTGEFLPITRQN